MNEDKRELARQLLHEAQTSAKAIALLTKLFDRFDPATLGVSFDEVRAHIDGVCVDLYAEHFTADEMRVALSWYTSEAGRAMQAKTPIVEHQVGIAMETYFKELFK